MFRSTTNPGRAVLRHALVRPVPPTTAASASRLLFESAPARPLQLRTFLFRRRRPSHMQSLNSLDVAGLYKAQSMRFQHKMGFLVAGFIASFVLACRLSFKLYKEITEGPSSKDAGAEGDEAEQDANSSSSPTTPNSPTSTKIQADSLPNTTPVEVGSKVVIHNPDGADLVPTNHPSVPYFPRTIHLPTSPSSTPSPDAPEETTEYRLVGLGIRTVSFLQFSVYVVALYIATPDISPLQSRLVHRVNPLASTLVPSERAELRRLLDSPDPQTADEIWSSALLPARSALRIVPVRETNFPHLRDGFVRALTHRRDPERDADEAFGRAVREFKHAFAHGKVAAGSELLLQRDGAGGLVMSFVDAKGSGRRVVMGQVAGEPRVSRYLWLNYLTGAVASPGARESIVQGVMDFVERPVGTVAAQVV